MNKITLLTKKTISRHRHSTNIYYEGWVNGKEYKLVHCLLFADLKGKIMPICW